MLDVRRKRIHAILLWLLSAAITMGSLCWRLFLPNYYQNNPAVWHIWLKGATVIIVLPLLLTPTGFYQWFPRLLQRWKCNRPWVLCTIILTEILLTFVLFGRTLYLAKSIAAAIITATILMVPQMDEKSSEKPLCWLLPSMLLLIISSGFSYRLPWRGDGQPDYHLGVVLGLIITSWLLVSTIKRTDVGKGKPLILALLPFVLSFSLVAVQHAVIAAHSGTIQMTLDRWRERVNIYSAMRSADPKGTTWMNIIIPIANIGFGLVLNRFGGELSNDSRRNTLFLFITYVLMILAGMFCFYAVLPDIETPVIMPHHSCMTALPISILCASFIGKAFAKGNWLRLNST